MKKNISINIGGIIFHIEEDGFDRLKKYLDSINQYFDSFEDSKEIIDDIENRIAEIFLGKLTDGNQVITMPDIEELIQTMGTVADFEASIETEPEEVKTQAQQKESAKSEEPEEEPQAQEKTSSSSGYKRLYRDNKHRVLGGVASGIAHYFNIDPIWIRLLILIMFFNIVFWGLSGITLLAYIILWIVLPGNDDLEAEKSVKKLYRNMEDRVLGGVSSGIAAYFGVDPTVIRLLFVLSIFLGGAGIILYIVMWIITPEARSITEKMEMSGEPVTLSNIETNVKKSLNVKEGEENVLIKILLFPFRLIAIIIEGLAKILGPLLRFLVEAFRILFAIIIIIFGLSLAFASLIFFLVLIGITFTWADYGMIDQLPFELVASSMNWLLATSFFLVTIIPAIAFVLLGFVILLRRSVTNAYIGWSLFGLWVLGLIGVAIFVPRIVRDFRTENDFKREQIFVVTSGVPTLKLNEQDYRDYDGVDLRLRGHSDSTYRLVVRIDSRGSSRQDAEENASAVTYEVNQVGDDFVFDSELDFGEAPFRFQEAEVFFYIPFGQKFMMERELSDILINTLSLNGYRSYQMEGNEWMFDRGGLTCLTCDKVNDRRSNRRDRSGADARPNANPGIYRDWDRVRGETETFDFTDFDRIKISSHFYVRIEQGDDYNVEIKGKDIDEVYLRKRGSRLDIEYKNDWDWWEEEDWGDPSRYIYITTPTLESLELIGACEGEIRGFDDDLEISLTGASKLDADIDPDNLDINLTGASSLTLEGRGERLDAKLVGASRLEAFDFRADRVDVQALGASKAQVYATDDLDIRAAGVSTVRYKGTNDVKVDSDGLSTVRRD